MDGKRILIIGAREYFPDILESLRNRGITYISGRDIALSDPEYEALLMGNPPKIVFCIGRMEEEGDTNMFRSTLAIAIAGVLSQRFGRTEMREHESFCILGTIEQQKSRKPYGHTGHHWYRRKHLALASHSLQMKLKVPRGIHRDSHGRPAPQKLTTARLTRRNGSRK